MKTLRGTAPSLALMLVAVSLGFFTLSNQGLAEDAKKSADPAVERARKTVRMLDDIYKSAIVLVTTHYVRDDKDLPAGSAFKELFEMVKEKGWHEVSLLDASGEPINTENIPAEGFEAEAIAKIKAGEPYYDRVEEKNGKRVLRAATAIPVVMQKCVMCHENYKQAGKGVAIGALGYVMPIDE